MRRNIQKKKQEQKTYSSTYVTLDYSHENTTYLLNYCINKYHISTNELSNALQTKISTENSFPLAILNTTKISSLEAIVKYLRENKGLQYTKIGQLLSRKPKALSSTYTNAKRKMQKKFSEDIELSNVRIAFSVFKGKLSILEAICISLKERGVSYSEIGRLLKKNPRTIWTVCKRAEKKNKKTHTKTNIPQITKENNNTTITNKSRNKQSSENYTPETSKYLLHEIITKYHISTNELSNALQTKISTENSFPLAILNTTKISSLEAIVKYLRENKGLQYTKIGQLLSRKPKALSSTYTNAKRKIQKKFSEKIESSGVRIEFSVFNNKLSILESIAVSLKKNGLSYSEIGRLLKKNPRTIWTVCKRAEKKLVDKKT